MSGFVGRMGNIVGRKGVGDTGYVVSAYQPQVLNPRTEGQVVQRTAFSMLVSLAKLFSRNLLVGLAASGRSKGGNWLSAFIAANYHAIVRDATGTAVTINYRDLVLSIGSEARPTMQYSEVEEADSLLTRLSVNVASEMTDSERAKGIRVICLIEGEKNRVLSVDVAPGETTANFDLSAPVGQSPYYGRLAHVWAYQIATPSSGAVVDYGDMEIGASVVQAWERGSRLSGLSYSDSAYLGSILLRQQA